MYVLLAVLLTLFSPVAVSSDEFDEPETDTAADLAVTEETPMEIVSTLRGISYIGDKTYNLSAYRDEERGAKITATDDTGILCAIYLDLDEDGTEENFSVTYYR